MSFATHAASRKCCPNRLRAFATPVALLDLFDLLLAEPEVVPDLVNERFRDAVAHIVFGLAVFFDDVPEQRDAIRQRVAVAPRPLRQRRALIQAVQRVGWLD